MARTFALPGFRFLLLICITLSSIAALPGAPVQAAVQRNQDVDNSLAEFEDGTFQMSASANYPPGEPQVGDTRGAVQLSPIAAIRGMTPSTGLPVSRMDAGVVAVGRNIFAIGGLVSNVRSNSVIASQVSLDTGALGSWVDQTALPAVQHSTTVGYTGAVSERTDLTAAALTTGQDSGFIYVLGGTVFTGGNTISSYSVLRASVVNGQISGGWVSLANIPTTNGLTEASSFIAELPNGKVFLYLIGGKKRFKPTGLPIRETGSRLIYYAELDPGSGNFINGGTGADTWKSTSFAIPLNPDPGVDGGLWNGAVVGGTFPDDTGLLKTSFYMLGGSTTAAAATTVVYRADVNDDGTLNMAQNSGVGATNATTGTSARTNHAAVQYNGSVYVAGGLVGSGATRDVLGSYVQPDQRFPEFGTGTAIYFITRQGLPANRTGHGMVVIPDSFSDPTKGYVYLIGGSDGTTAQTTVFRTIIGDLDVTDVSFPLEGYYVSEPVPFLIGNSRLRGIFWRTDQPAGANIAISFRYSNDSDCSVLAAKTNAEAPWLPTTGGSTPGVLNTFSLTSGPANCFQYRARLTPNAAPDDDTDNLTPFLLRLGIQIEVPGATDLTVKSFDFSRGPDTKPNGLAIVLHNENIFLPNEPTLAADFGEDGPGSAPGSFFVDVFIYPPGITPPADQPIPTSPTQYSRLSIDVFRSELQGAPTGAGGFDFTIPLDRPLCDYNTRVQSGACVQVGLRSLFPEAGTYQVVVVVDGDNNVAELPSDPGQAEANNVFLVPGGITVADPDDLPETPGAGPIFLPVIVAP